MAYHPLNLALRFLLELWLLYALGAWGRQRASGALGWLVAAALVVAAGALWGAFRVPHDGGAPRVTISGRARLSLEAVLFGAAVWGLADLGRARAALLLALVLAAHYAIGWDRTWKLVRNRPLGPTR